MSDCPFHALGLNPSASESEILKTWRRLELAHHPDKDTSADAIEVSKRFNEAKDKAIHIIRRKHELQEHIKLLRHHTSEELKAPLNDDLRLSVYGMVGFLQQATRKYHPNPEIGGYFRLVKKLEDDQESARSERERAKRERDDAIARANELERERDEALSKIEELTRENDNAITKLTHEKDDALSKMAELARERDETLSKMAELTNERDKALNKMAELTHERDEALLQIESISIEETSTQNEKKRKHVRVYTNQQDNASFKETVSHFVQSNFQVSQDASYFITTKQILDMFISDGFKVASETLFFRELAKQMKHHFPSIIKKKVDQHNTYHGISPSCSSH
jgi:curved DNA-binding protein CbpA